MNAIHLMAERLQMTLAWHDLVNAFTAGFVVTRGPRGLWRAHPISHAGESERMVSATAANALKVASRGNGSRAYTAADARGARDLVLSALSFLHAASDSGVQS